MSVFKTGGVLAALAVGAAFVAPFVDGSSSRAATPTSPAHNAAVVPLAAASAPLPPRSAVPVVAELTSGFGMRWGSLHGGIDLAAPIGTPIVAAAAGEILEAGGASGYGQWVRVLQDDGTIAIYGHIDSYLVTAGQRVVAGQRIATVGNRGYSTGAHLHYEITLPNGDKIDPIVWFARRGLMLLQPAG